MKNLAWLGFGVVLIGFGLSGVVWGDDAFPDYDPDGKPWFQKYFDSGRVDEITGVERSPDWFLKGDAEFGELVTVKELPTWFDLREAHPQKVLQPIRNQRSCGSCWAHSVIAAVESAYALLHPEETFLDLSEQELVSSCPGTGGSCMGGYFSAFGYIAKPGLPLEEEEPYVAANTRCRSDVKRVPRISTWKYIGRVQDGKYRGPTIEQLKTAIYTLRQEVSVTVKAFSHEGDGIYTRCQLGGINHMVNLSGWYDFESEDDVKKYGAKGYWIMRNSWGMSFGKSGYAKVLYTDRYGRLCNNLGEAAAVVTIER